MSETFSITSSGGPYEVHIGHDHPNFIESNQVFYLVDQRFYEAWLDWVPGKALKIQAFEDNKTLASCGQIIEAMRMAGMTRESQLIAFGGGIIQDLATLCASLYMRGIKWTYCPTTLLGMVDSCVGGKSSINVGQYKNIAGNYYPPEKVVINVEFCKTLPLTEQIAGLCEAVKICFAAKNNAFDTFITHLFDCHFPLSNTQLEKIITLSLRTKKIFIEEDEFDQGSRLLLNFGHTIGHAIEAASHFSVAHGVAVGLGMLAEIRLAMSIHSQTNFSERVRLLNDYICNLVKLIPEMTKHIQLIDSQKVLNAFQSDKKHLPENYRLISVNQDGYLERISIPKNDQSDEMIVGAFEWLKGAVTQ